MSKALTFSIVATVLAFAGPVFGAGLFESPTERANRESSARQWSAAREQLREQIEAFNVQIAEAREKFWALYPDQPGADEANRKFAGLLREKDAYYLSVVLSGGMLDMGGVGVQLDEGIRRSASPEFEDLVTASRGGVGGSDLMQIFRSITGAIDAHPAEYRKYALERDWWEFDQVHRIPAGFEKPETYGVYLYHRFGRTSRDAAATTYNQMAEVLGKPVVYAAAKRVMDTPKNDRGVLDVTVPRPVKIGPGGSELEDPSVPRPDAVFGVFGDPLEAMEVLATKDDDRRYLLYLLTGQNRPNGRDWDRVTKWAFADTTYKQLVMAYGEKPLLEAARAVRTATKRLIGGTVMDVKALGASRNAPFTVFEDVLARRNPRGYVRAALLFKEGLESGPAVDAAYKTFISSGNEAEVLAAARRLAAGRPNVLYRDELRSLVDTLTSPPEAEKPPEAMVDYPEYQSWKGFTAGAKVTYTTRYWQPGRVPGQMVPGALDGTVSYLLKSIKPEQADLWFTQTAYDQFGRAKPARDDEIGYPSTIMQKTVTANAARAAAAGPVARSAESMPAAASLAPDRARVWSKIATVSPVESGEETLEIEGKRIATKWQSASYTFDPTTTDKDTTVIVKVWTSKAVPTWLVRKTEDKMMPADYYHPGGNRVVSETSLVSFAGFTPPAPAASLPVVAAYQPPPRAPAPNAAPPAAPAVAVQPKPVVDPTARTPAAPARAVAIPVAQPTAVPTRTVVSQPAATMPSPFNPAASTPAPGGQAMVRRQPDPMSLPPDLAAQVEFARQFGAVMNRAAQAKYGLMQWQYKQGAAGATLPADVAAARDRLDLQTQAVVRAMGARDNALASQEMRSVEDSAAVIERFLGKGS